MELPVIKVDIEVYDQYDDHWVQAKYLAHSHDDCLWTNDLAAATQFIKDSIYEYEASKLMPTMDDD